MMQKYIISLAEEERKALKRIVRSLHSEPRQILRAKIILLADAGKLNKEIAAKLGITSQKVARWRKRFTQLGIPGILKDAPRTGRPALLTKTDVDKIAKVLLHEKPESADRWSVRTLAKRVNKTRYAVHKVLRDFNINLEKRNDWRVSLKSYFEGDAPQGKTPPRKRS